MTDGGGEDGATEVVAGPWFSRILLAVIALMFICLFLWIGLAIAITAPTSGQATMIDGVSRGFTGSLGAILGLLGGKLA
jgi:hypothetical protein